MSDSFKTELLSATAEVVASYVEEKSLSSKELTKLIETVYGTFERLACPASSLKPAVPIHKSVLPDYLICLEDGKKLKTLKRHLQTKYHLTPEAYRERWGLPSDYPLVAPGYAQQRSRMAKKSGLGQQRRLKRSKLNS